MTKFTLNTYISSTKSDKNIPEYNKRYEEIKTKIKQNWYSVKDSGHLVVKFDIPSEKVGGIGYDVIIEFNVGHSATFMEFKNTQIQVFSNCPSFIYMNAYFCKKSNLLIDWALPMYKDQNIFNEPIKKDPESPTQNNIRCEKSLYYAIKYLTSLSPVQMYLNASQSTKLPNSKILLQHIQGTDEVDKKRSDTISKEKTKLIKEKENEVAAAERKMKLKSIFSITHTDSVKSIKSKNTNIKSIKKIKHI